MVEPARPPSRRNLGPAFGGLLVLGLLGWGIIGPPGAIACGALIGWGSDILVPIERCEVTRRRLGTPVELSFVGTGCTNYQSGRQFGPGTAWGTVPVAGPLGSASYTFRANRAGDTWIVGQGLVTFPDGAKTDVVACLGPTGMADLSNQALRDVLASLCEQDDASRCHSLGEALRDGQWGAADPAGARAAFDRACRLGNAPSCAARDAMR